MCFTNNLLVLEFSYKFFDAAINLIICFWSSSLLEVKCRYCVPLKVHNKMEILEVKNNNRYVESFDYILMLNLYHFNIVHMQNKLFKDFFNLYMKYLI